MELALTNVVNISVSQAQAGVGDYNTSNLALFSSDPAAETFGDDGYKIYLSPEEVETDFGSDSTTFKMANALFSQRPNILTGNGYLVIIAMIAETQSIAFSAVATSGSMILNFDGSPTAPVLSNDTQAQIQAKVRAVAGLENAVVVGTLATSLVISKVGDYGNVPIITVTSNTLLATSTPVVATPSETVPGETLGQAVSRTEDLVQYFGLMSTVVLPDADLLAAAAIVQPLNKILFAVQTDPATVETGGTLDLLRTGNLHKTRGLLYGSTSVAALVFQASYAGRGLSTDFAGSNTTSTMHLKDLPGVQPDPSMTQTLLTKCQAAGADVYVSLQGVAKTFCSGANAFFDQVYNLEWFVGALQVAGFNFLAQASTKIPQTESGMDGLKSAYRKVCEAALTNQYAAPGEWTSATTFGNQGDFLANVTQRGYYIFSQPIATQLPTARAARTAPLVQIALKEAGAIHKSSVIVNVNA